MAKKDYKKLSDDIIAAVGGVSNIRSASHCMTRLRLNLKDNSKLDVEEAKKIPGVINIIMQNGEQQFVIGQDVAVLCRRYILTNHSCIHRRWSYRRNHLSVTDIRRP